MLHHSDSIFFKYYNHITGETFQKSGAHPIPFLATFQILYNRRKNGPKFKKSQNALTSQYLDCALKLKLVRLPRWTR